MESNNETQKQEATEITEQPSNMVEEAKKVVEEMKRQNEEFKSLVERQEKAKSLEILGGTSTAGTTKVEEKKELTPREYAKQVLAGIYNVKN